MYSFKDTAAPAWENNYMREMLPWADTHLGLAEMLIRDHSLVRVK